ncbi:MAG: hypothetical protein GY788_21995 [bacterium]|nr:hypothetical protein [bacterium]
MRGWATLALAALLIAACSSGEAASPNATADVPEATLAIPTTAVTIDQVAAEPEVVGNSGSPVDDIPVDDIPADDSKAVPEETSTEVTTTTEPPPVDERLPRTEAEATETDPVPVGEVVEAAQGVWDIAITGVDLDAAETVLSFADINPQPAPGFRYVLVTVEGTYLGETVAQPVFDWAMIAGGNEYRPSIPGCGVVPDSLYDVVEVVPGQSFAASICMPIAGSDLGAGLELFLHAPGDDPHYFELR